MEYVHIPLLCEVMSSLVKELFRSQEGYGTSMMNLVAIIALGGEFMYPFYPQITPHYN